MKYIRFSLLLLAQSEQPSFSCQCSHRVYIFHLFTLKLYIYYIEGMFLVHGIYIYKRTNIYLEIVDFLINLVWESLYFAYSLHLINFWLFGFKSVIFLNDFQWHLSQDISLGLFIKALSLT